MLPLSYRIFKKKAIETPPGMDDLEIKPLIERRFIGFHNFLNFDLEEFPNLKNVPENR